MFEVTREGIVLFGLSIRFYGILIALGVAGALWLAARREERYGLERDSALSMALWVMPVAIVCARLYYVVFSWDTYRDDLMRIFLIREGGLAIYGGIIGGVITGIVWTKVKKVSALAMADVIAPGLALGQALGRWGNFLNREAYGMRIESPALQFFPLSVYIEAEEGYFAATFFYESVWCLLICMTLLWAEKFRPFEKHGHGALLYLVLYSAERALVEGLRTDSLYWGTVRVSQALSVLILAFCGVCLILSSRRRRLIPAMVVVCGVLFAYACAPAFFPWWVAVLMDAFAAGMAVWALWHPKRA